jgi:hypothetical protein
MRSRLLALWLNCLFWAAHRIGIPLVRAAMSCPTSRADRLYTRLNDEIASACGVRYGRQIDMEATCRR